MKTSLDLMIDKATALGLRACLKSPTAECARPGRSSAVIVDALQQFIRAVLSTLLRPGDGRTPTKAVTAAKASFETGTYSGGRLPACAANNAGRRSAIHWPARRIQV